MLTKARFLLSAVLITIPIGAGLLASAQDDRKLDADRIAAAAGAKATTTDDGVVRIGWPRNDVAVKVDGMPLKPFAGLGSWAAFTKAPHGAMAMGDTVVFEDEVTPAMDAAFANGLEVTGLHNHFLFDEPKVYFMHVGGTGEPEKLAAGRQGGLGRHQGGAEGESRAAAAVRRGHARGGDDRGRPDREVPRAEGPGAGRGGQGDDRPGGRDARGEGRRLDGPDDLGGVLRLATSWPPWTATSS